MNNGKRNVLASIAVWALCSQSPELSHASVSTRQSMYGIRTAVAASHDLAVVSRFGASSEGESAIDIPEGVFVFRRSSDSWELESTLSARESAPGFGWAVAASRTTLAVSSPGAEPQPSGPDGLLDESIGAVHVFRKDAGGWDSPERLSIHSRIEGKWHPLTGFGRSLAVDGDTLVVGAPNYGASSEESRGAVIVFSFSENTWSEVCRLVPDDGKSYEAFGTSVAIDGETIVVGAPAFVGRGYSAVYIFQRVGKTWMQVKRVVPEQPACSWFGSSVDVSGSHIVVGSGRQDAFNHVEPLCSGMYRCRGCVPTEGTAFILARKSDGKWGSPVRLTEHSHDDHSGCHTTVSIGPQLCVVRERVIVNEADLSGLSTLRIFKTTDSGTWPLSSELEEDTRKLTTTAAISGLEVLVTTIGRQSEEEACTIARVLRPQNDSVIPAKGSALVVCD